jgi:hypothetical protein
MESYSDMKEAAFEDGRESALRDLEEMCQRVVDKIGRRIARWKSRDDDGFEVKEVLHFFVIQQGFYQEMVDYLQDERKRNDTI